MNDIWYKGKEKYMYMYMHMNKQIIEVTDPYFLQKMQVLCCL